MVNPPRPVSRVRHAAGYAWLVLRASITSFTENNSLQTAATLAYYGCFASIPMLLVVFILLSYLTVSSQAVLASLDRIVSEAAPGVGGVILSEIQGLATNKLWGVVSVVVLIWVATPFAASIRIAMATVFKTGKSRGFLRTKLFNLVAVLALLFLFLLSVAGDIFFGSLAKGWLEQRGFGGAEWLHRIFMLTATLLSMGFFYFVFSPVRLKRSELLVAALVTAALLGVIRPAFRLFLQINPNYGYAFGSLKTIFLLTVWVYYAFLAVLFTAEVVANMRRREALLLRTLFRASKGTSAWVSPLLQRFVKRYDKGDVLFEEGDRAGEMYYILNGAVDVVADGRVIHAFSAGSYFGEMAMLLDEKRTAAVRISAPDTDLVCITRPNFEILLRENPDITKTMLTEMAARLKATTHLTANER